MQEFSNTYIDNFISRFKSAEKKFSAPSLQLKEDGINALKRLGFPTSRNEEWKYTNVSKILENDFAEATSHFFLTDTDLKNIYERKGDELLLIFENGKYNSRLSDTVKLPKGIVCGSILEHQNHPEVQKHLGKISSQEKQSFVALNTAFFSDGFFLFAEKNITTDKPIHLLFINDSKNQATITYPRNLIVISSGASVNVSESYHTLDSANASFVNSVNEIFVDDNGMLEYNKFQSESSNDFHIDTTTAFLQRNTTFKITTITSGGKIVRNNLRIELQQPGGSAYLNGLYIINGENHVDNHTTVDHASANCYSNEFYKGILDGHSHGVFNGKIYVRRDAQKTNAYQSNKNIILSDNATMSAKPQLEIYADDVKCSHGATTGQLDAEALFYLRSRGIGLQSARALLTMAFAEEIIDKIIVSSFVERIKERIDLILGKVND